MLEWVDGSLAPYLKERERERRRRMGEDVAVVNSNDAMPHHIILLDCWYGHTDEDFRAHTQHTTTTNKLFSSETNEQSCFKTPP